MLPRRIHETDHLSVVVEGSDESFPLARFGDGTVKWARIFMEMARYPHGRLMIDEIDAGIHYRRLDHFWTAIAQAAFESDIQIFAATHSLECLKSLKRVFESAPLREHQSEVRCIALELLADQQTVRPYTYSWEEFQSASGYPPWFCHS